MKRFICGVLASLIAIWCLSVLAVEPKPAEQAKPAERQIDASLKDKVGKLIDQLGDNSWEKRQAASAELEAIGRPAVPFLATAQAKHGDAEVRFRAEIIIGNIESSATKKLLDTIEIPEVNFQKATIGQVLEFIVKESQRLDADRVGINLRLSERVDKNLAVVGLQMKNVKLADLLKEGLGKAGLSYSLGTEGILVDIVTRTPPPGRRVRPRPVEEEE